MSFTRMQGIVYLTGILMLINTALVFSQDFEGVIEYQITTKAVDNDEVVEQEEETIYVAGNMMRIDEPGNNQSTIMRMDKELIWHIDHDEKTYQEISFQQMRQGMEKAQAAMEEAMKKMTPEQKKMMEQMGMKMPGMQTEKMFDLQKTGKSATVNGYKCEQYILKKSGHSGNDEEWWVTKDLGKFENFGKMMAKMFEGMSGGMMSGMESFAKLDGIPVKMVEQDENEQEITEIKNVTQTDVAPAKFTPPENYRKKEMDMPSSWK